MVVQWQPALAAEHTGPHDADVVAPELLEAPGLADFGAVRVPIPVRGTVTVDPGEHGRMQAVHVSLPEGRLSVSALAAPKSSRLWPDLVKEIDASLRDGGARVRSFQGEWGRELHATSGAATSVFVGVDGARWMLYGVATGPTRDAGRLLEELRRVVRGTIVVRGRSPYPVRTVLPLEMPVQPGDAGAPAAETVVVRAVAPAGAADRTVAIPGRGFDDAPTQVWAATATERLPVVRPGGRHLVGLSGGGPGPEPEVPRSGRHAAQERPAGGEPLTVPLPRVRPVRRDQPSGRHRRRD